MKIKEFGPQEGTRVPGAPLRSANADIETGTEVFVIHCKLMSKPDPDVFPLFPSAEWDM